MPDLYVLADHVPDRLTSDGGVIRVRGDRSGIPYVMPGWEALAAEGRIFSANMGSVTTPLTFLVTAANRPDAWVRVPSGTTILPLRVVVALEAYAGTATELDLRMAENDIGNGTSTAASVGPQRLRTDGSITSACTARQLATADTTAETNPISLYRRTYASAGAAGSEPGNIDVTREMMGFPILVGPATLELFIAATTTQATGFVIMTWAEVPSTAFTG